MALGEWWTYGLSDFLMFSPRSHARLVASWNDWHAPARWVAGSVIPVMLLALLRQPGGARWGAGLLALAWAWVGWAFHWQRYSALFLGATALAVAFWLEAGLLGVVALRPSTALMPRRGVTAAGWTIVAAALLAWPLATAWDAGGPAHAEVFGWMPDPTALATIGLVLTGTLPARTCLRRVLLVLPAIVLGVGLLTRRALLQYATA